MPFGKPYSKAEMSGGPGAPPASGGNPFGKKAGKPPAGKPGFGKKAAGKKFGRRVSGKR
jgi:hypothetical protein